MYQRFGVFEAQST